jgi:hypothetical protein
VFDGVGCVNTVGVGRLDRGFWCFVRVSKASGAKFEMSAAVAVAISVCPDAV